MFKYPLLYRLLSLYNCVYSGNFPAISDDLVNSYHLLLSCLDLLYSNAVGARHTKEMVDPNFTDGNIDYILHG